MGRIACTSILRWGVLGIVTVGWTAQAAAQLKAPIPDVQALQKARKNVEELYGDRIKEARSPSAKVALAESIMEMATRVDDGSADQYVLLLQARTVAEKAGEVAPAMKALDTLGRLFQAPIAKFKAQSLLKAADAAASPAAQKTYVEVALKVLDELAATDESELAPADELKLATDVCQAAFKCARATKQDALIKDVRQRTDALKARSEEIEKYLEALAVVQDRPTDAPANVAAGKYLCFFKGDWNRGIAMLALGDDATLQKLAGGELQGAPLPDEQLRLADDWWDLAKTWTGKEKGAIEEHSRYWYRRCVLQLKGLDRGRAEQRLADSKDPGTKPGAGKKSGKLRPVTAQYTFADRNEMLKNWEPREGWRLENGGVKLTGLGRMLMSKESLKGDADIRITYNMPHWNDLSLNLWGQTFTVSQSGNQALWLKRTGNQVVYGPVDQKLGILNPREAKSIVLNDEEANRSAPLEIHMNSAFGVPHELLIYKIIMTTMK